MVEWHQKSKKKVSGGMRRTNRRRDKRLASRGGVFAATKVGEKEHTHVVKPARVRGGGAKLKVETGLHANVLDPKTQKTVQMDLLGVKENAANREFSRRNLITKGAVIEVKSGEKTLTAVVTSRPGQSGVINAKLAQ